MNQIAEIEYVTHGHPVVSSDVLFPLVSGTSKLRAGRENPAVGRDTTILIRDGGVSRAGALPGGRKSPKPTPGKASLNRNRCSCVRPNEVLSRSWLWSCGFPSAWLYQS